MAAELTLAGIAEWPSEGAQPPRRMAASEGKQSSDHPPIDRVSSAYGRSRFPSCASYGVVRWDCAAAFLFSSSASSVYFSFFFSSIMRYTVCSSFSWALLFLLLFFFLFLFLSLFLFLFLFLFFLSFLFLCLCLFLVCVCVLIIITQRLVVRAQGQTTAYGGLRSA